MNDRNKHVAISYDYKGKCVQLSLVKAINEQEYKKLLNEQHEHESELEQKNRLIVNELKEHHDTLIKLHGRDLFIAKSTYDKFVDRGYINEDKDFDKDFYDFIFNDCELDLDKAPQEFKLILEKVVK